MKIFDPNIMMRGWYVGDFEPTAYRTKDFEVSVMTHRKGESWPAHYHEKSTEINYLLEGNMTLQGRYMEAPTIFVLEPGEIADPTFHTDVKLVVIKTPSAPGDKVIINKEISE